MFQKLLPKFTILLVVSMVLALGYWNLAPDKQEDNTDNQADTSIIDYYIGNGSTRQFRPDGTLNYEMTAIYTEHYKVTDTAFLDKPYGLLYKKGDTETPWHISSKTGRVGPEGKVVDLIDDVVMVRTDENGETSRLTTTTIKLFPDKKYAETQQPVKMENAGNITTGTGMKVYADEGKVHLLSNVDRKSVV